MKAKNSKVVSWGKRTKVRGEEEDEGKERKKGNRRGVGAGGGLLLKEERERNGDSFGFHNSARNNLFNPTQKAMYYPVQTNLERESTQCNNYYYFFYIFFNITITIKLLL